MPTENNRIELSNLRKVELKSNSGILGDSTGSDSNQEVGSSNGSNSNQETDSCNCNTRKVGSDIKRCGTKHCPCAKAGRMCNENCHLVVLDKEEERRSVKCCRQDD